MEKRAMRAEKALEGYGAEVREWVGGRVGGNPWGGLNGFCLNETLQSDYELGLLSPKAGADRGSPEFVSNIIYQNY